MLKKGLISASLAALCFFSPVSFADIFVNGTGSCQNLAGKWHGEGKISATILGVPLHCHYQGNIVATTNDNQTFKIDIKLHKESGLGCPEDESMTKTAHCSNGTITITDDANLYGSIYNNDTEVSLNGTIKIYIKQLDKKIDANVDELNVKKNG